MGGNADEGGHPHWRLALNEMCVVCVVWVVYHQMGWRVVQRVVYREM